MDKVKEIRIEVELDNGQVLKQSAESFEVAEMNLGTIEAGLEENNYEE